jgi:plasmid maintenance system antidote protein VapI
MNLEKAAEQLNIDQTYLSSIIHGRIRTSQGSVSKKDWQRVLSEHYADGWKQYGTMFDQHTSALKKRAGVPGVEPKDKNSFGYILWLILGGKDLNARQISEDLKIHPVALSMLFHGRQSVSQKTLIKKQWREVLAREYGEGWQEHADEFEKYAAALSGGAGNSKIARKIKSH